MNTKYCETLARMLNKELNDDFNDAMFIGDIGSSRSPKNQMGRT